MSAFVPAAVVWQTVSAVVFENVFPKHAATTLSTGLPTSNNGIYIIYNGIVLDRIIPDHSNNNVVKSMPFI